uniref:Uncharacterized protein n=1 Tax=Trichogramma kaykai TaxID=54128 RepID=A0ABD2W406_9HYME
MSELPVRRIGSIPKTVKVAKNRAADAALAALWRVLARLDPAESSLCKFNDVLLEEEETAVRVDTEDSSQFAIWTSGTHGDCLYKYNPTILCIKVKNKAFNGVGAAQSRPYTVE